MSAPSALIERRDAGAIREIARHLIVTAESLTTGDGLLTLVRADSLAQLRDAFGDDGLADVWVVIDGPGLRAAKHPAGLRAIEDELRVVRAMAKPAIEGPPITTLRPEIVAEREANLAARKRRAIEPATGGRRWKDGTASVDPNPMTPEQLKAAMTALDLTSRQLGAAVGRSHYTVRDWMCGRRHPSLEIAAEIRRLVAEQKGVPTT